MAGIYLRRKTISLSFVALFFMMFSILSSAHLLLVHLSSEPLSSIQGNPIQGKQAITRYGCNACHDIPGIDGPKGGVGPSLAGIGTRAYIAGVLPNQPEAMIRWLRYPQQVDPKTAMPDLNVGEQDAADIAAYLSTLD